MYWVKLIEKAHSSGIIYLEGLAKREQLPNFSHVLVNSKSWRRWMWNKRQLRRGSFVFDRFMFFLTPQRPKMPEV